MTNPSYTHYVLIVDRSGSMVTIAQDATGGIQQFVKDQMELPGQSSLSLYQFDHLHETVHDFTRLKEARDYVLQPRGGTALLDAVGFAVTEVGQRLASMDEADRPGKVVVLIVTDGQENSSHEYTRQQVRELVTQQAEKYGWHFTYIGANVDAFAEAGNIGIPVASAMGYQASSVGTRSAYAGASASVSRLVTNSATSLEYTQDERDASQGEL